MLSSAAWKANQSNTKTDSKPEQLLGARKTSRKTVKPSEDKEVVGESLALLVRSTRGKKSLQICHKSKFNFFLVWRMRMFTAGAAKCWSHTAQSQVIQHHLHCQRSTINMIAHGATKGHFVEQTDRAGWTCMFSQVAPGRTSCVRKS